jgi:hypothetical protein
MALVRAGERLPVQENEARATFRYVYQRRLAGFAQFDTVRAPAGSTAAARRSALTRIGMPALPAAREREGNGTRKQE